MLLLFKDEGDTNDDDLEEQDTPIESINTRRALIGKEMTREV